MQTKSMFTTLSESRLSIMLGRATIVVFLHMVKQDYGFGELPDEAEPGEDIWVGLSGWRCRFHGFESVFISSWSLSINIKKIV